MKKTILLSLTLALPAIFGLSQNTRGIRPARLVLVQAYASGVNVHTGAVPTVEFDDPSTGQVLYSFTIMSSEENLYVAPATYNIVITQTDNKSFSASIPGYGSQSGQTLTFDNVSVTANMSMYISDN